MIDICISFMDSSINIKIEEKNMYRLKPVMTLFGTHLDITRSLAENPIAWLNIFSADEYKSENFIPRDNRGKEVIMRVSSAERFNLSAMHYVVEGLDIFECKDSKTIMIFDFENKNVDIYASEDSDIQIIELIRDTIIKDQENKGTLVLHAAAAVNGSNAVVIVGSKGAGKTTTLLELVMNGGYRMVSGDKLFLKVEEDGVKLTGWPDYPHLGVGTILKHSKLVDMVKRLYCKDVERMLIQKKILIQPDVLVRETGIEFSRETHKLDKILFPKLIDNVKSKLAKMDTPSIEDIIENLEFKGDYPQNKWNRLVIPDYQKREENVDKLRKAVRNCSYYILEGNLRMSDEIVKELTV